MKRLLLIISIFAISITLFGQTDLSKEKSSLIVSLDKRAPRVTSQDYWNSKLISRTINNVLSKNNIYPDVVSGVLYGVKKGSKKPTDFSTLIVEPSTQLNNLEELIQTLHSNLPKGEYYSITSFAKPYSLISLKNRAVTNKTFLILSTDGMYNGNDDYYGEAEYVAGKINQRNIDKENGFSVEGKAEFRNTIKGVQTNYFCEFIDEERITNGYIQLYEFVPLQQYFALESVLNFPHKITAKRQKDGYEIRLSSTSVDNKDYEIQKLYITLSKDDESKGRDIETDKCNQIIISQQEIKVGEDVVINVSKEDIDNVHLKLKSWVKLCDNVYDNTVLHPNGSKLQGADGLKREITIEKEQNATILGILPLSDFMFSISFWTSSQSTAATCWGWIIIAIAIVLIVVAIRKSNIYKPNAKETKI